MPLFTFKCLKCEEKREFLVGFQGSPKEKCDKCSSTKWKKEFTQKMNIAFKGTGFYVTDNKRK